MIECLISCLLMGTAEEHLSDGQRFVSTRMRVNVGGGDWLYGNVVTSNQATGDRLLALRDGEAVALAGTLRPKAWIDGDGDPRIILEMLAHTALTVRDARMPSAPGA